MVEQPPSILIKKRVEFAIVCDKNDEACEMSSSCEYPCSLMKFSTKYLPLCYYNLDMLKRIAEGER